MIATNNTALYVAKQSARGVYPAAATYRLEVIEGNLVSKPSQDILNVADGRIWGPARKRVGYLETGGQVTFVTNPSSAGLFIYAALGADSVAGAGDPYTHTMTPATSMSGFPYLCFWQYFDGQWSFYGDCQVASLDIECGTDAKFMRLKPTIIGLAAEASCAALGAPPAVESDQYHWLDAGGYHVLGGDYANIEYSAVPTDLATLKTWLTAFKVHYNAHCAVATGRHHKAADATNTLGYADSPADLAACIVDLTEIRADLIAHEALTTTHYFADTTANNPSSAWIEPCVTLADCLAAAQDCVGAVNSPGCYNRHLGAIAGLRRFTISIGTNANPLQGEYKTAYTVHRRQGQITAAVDMLLEDFRTINLVKYGDPVPAAGTEVLGETQTSSLTEKYTASLTGAERSIQIIVPQFDYDPDPLMSVTGNPDGTEVYVTCGGEASGTDPICTIKVMNAVAAY